MSGVQVPPLVVAALTEELALLSASSRRVLDGASVAGDPFEPELAAAAADVSEQQAIDAIDELLERDLVRPTNVPRRFRFRHPIVRRAVYEATPGGWRIGAHERVAAALAERGAGAAVAPTTSSSPPRSETRQRSPTLAEAGQKSAQRAPATAARWFSGALRLLRTPRRPSNASSCCCRQRHGAGGDRPLRRRARGSAREPRTRSRRGVREQSELVSHVRARRASARPPRAGSCAAAARLGDLPDAAGADAVTLMLELAADGVYRLQYEAGQEWAERAVAAAEDIGDPALQAAALATLARALAWGGEPNAASGALRGGRARRRAAPTSSSPAGWTPSSTSPARRSTSTASSRPARTPSGRSRSAEPPARVSCSPASTRPSAWRGACSAAWAKPPSCSTRATEAARLSGNPQALAWALFCRAFVAVPAGDHKTAIAAGQESLDLAKDASQDVIAARAASILAVALLDAGEPDRAAAVLASRWAASTSPPSPTSGGPISSS